ncbi:hypothetical protein PI125_g20024 [Phytophthora idaei]|nr:hypothetical protein PI125_g20024 [Phytophthora idaei]
MEHATFPTAKISLSRSDEKDWEPIGALTIGDCRV